MNSFHSYQTDVLSVNEDLSGDNIIKSEQESDDGTFTTAWVTHLK